MEPSIFFVVPINYLKFTLALRNPGLPWPSQQVVQADNSSSLLTGPAEDVVEKMAMAQNSGT
ncbi:hypothetical protein [Methanosarcina sp.]|uniref:hypothetical protein n=1 Tax=Methanosarcina sp. TaxID=2213 RepID=UPI002ABC4F93|nr:hypothetical protein [Methanosarcina sp.]MDY9925449.1 hypothetical protein [Methanosarcina sp.]